MARQSMEKNSKTGQPNARRGRANQCRRARGKKGHGTARQGMARQSRAWEGMEKRAIQGRPS